MFSILNIEIEWPINLILPLLHYGQRLPQTSSCILFIEKGEKKIEHQYNRFCNLFRLSSQQRFFYKKEHLAQ